MRLVPKPAKLMKLCDARGPFLAACAAGGVACAALFHQGKPVQPPRNSPASRANSAARRRRRCHTGREPVRLTARSRSLSATLAAASRVSWPSHPRCMDRPCGASWMWHLEIIGFAHLYSAH